MLEQKVNGTKFDKAKPRMDLLDMDALEGLAAVLSFGAEKYEPYNWRLGIVNSRLIASMLRHLSAIQRGEDIDPESGLSHIDHLGCNWMFLSYNYKRRPDLDDRPRLHQSSNQSECSEHSDNTVLETVNANRQHSTPLDWTASQLCNDKPCKPSMAELVAEAQRLGFYDIPSISGHLRQQSDGQGIHGTRKHDNAKHDVSTGYYSSPWGYLSNDIAKANIALQKELDND